MKMYTTTIWPFATFNIILLVVMGFIGYSGIDVSRIGHVTKAFSALCFVVIGNTILFGWFTYVKIIDDKIMKHVQLAIYRKKALIANITHIKQDGTYYAASNIIKSLYVYHTLPNGKKRFFHLSMALYSGQTLSRLLRDLKTINPNIKLDNSCQKLMIHAKAYWGDNK